jgi:hypothetical protein
LQAEEGRLRQRNRSQVILDSVRELAIESNKHKARPWMGGKQQDIILRQHINY